MIIKPMLPIAIFTISYIYGLDLRYGHGSMDVKSNIKNFMNSDVSLDVDVVSLHEEHHNIANSDYYLFTNIDIYNSKALNQYTDFVDKFMNIPILPLPSVPPLPSIPTNPFPVPLPPSIIQPPTVITTLPTIPDTPNDMLGKFVPVPSSYEMNGFDMDIGIGYDVVKGDDYYLGTGISTGISMPFIKMENYLKSAEYLNKLLKTTHTDISTYKLGVSLQGGYSFKYFNLYANGIYAYQRGKISNSIMYGSMDANGVYSSIEAGVTFHPLKLIDTYKDTPWSNIYMSIGYTHKEWLLDEVNGQIFGIPAPKEVTNFESSFKTDYTYLGVGYKF